MKPVSLYVEDFRVMTTADYQRVLIFRAGMSTADVYNKSQTNDNIHHADVLIVPDEAVIGFMWNAWPVAVSDNLGEFHGLQNEPRRDDDPKLERAYRVARDIAENGYSTLS